MSRLALYGLLALSLGGIAYCSMHTGGRPNKEYLQLIERLLQEQLNTQPNICVQAGPFPFKAGDQPRYYGNPPNGEPRWVWPDEYRDWGNASDAYQPFDACRRCEDLLQAGILETTEEQSEVNGNIRVIPTYRLSSLGLQLFRSDIQQKPGKIPMPGVCLADKLVLHKFDEFLPMQKFGQERMIGFKYTLEAVRPHAFLFDPANAPLKLPALQQKSPALFAPEISTARIFNGGKDGELDSSLRYGKYVNQ